MPRETTMEIRDKRGGNRFFVDNAVLKVYGTTLGPYGLSVYMALCMYANGGQECWPSRASIAKLVGCSVRQVSKSLSQLEELGLVSREQRFTERGQTSNVYTLLAVPDAPAPAGQEPTPEADAPNTQEDAPAPDPQPKPERQKRRGKPPRQRSAAVMAYHDATGRWTNRMQEQAIDATVTDLDRWKEVLTHWVMKGYNGGNVQGMLDWYRNGIPSNGNGHKRPRVPADKMTNAEMDVSAISKEQIRRQLGGKGG